LYRRHASRVSPAVYSFYTVFLLALTSQFLALNNSLHILTSLVILLQELERLTAVYLFERETKIFNDG